MQTTIYYSEADEYLVKQVDTKGDGSARAAAR